MKNRALQSLKYSFTSIMIGVCMMSCTSYGKNFDLASQERMENSPQYQDGKFQNVKKIDLYELGKTWRAFKEFFFSKRVDPVPQEAISLQWVTGKEFYSPDDQALRFVRLGHSTLMLQVGGKIWLTDPVFSKRASPVQWMGPKRFHPVPIKVEELPSIEGVLISHNHYDHLDYDSIVQLKDRVKHFLVPLGIGKILISWGVAPEKITELDWWEKKKIGNVELVSTPAQHFSGRTLFDADETLWTSWVIRTPEHSIYFSGDTGYFEGFKEIGEKYGPFDLAFLECGAYHQNWRTIHMMPEDTLQAFKDLKGKVMVPIHNGTFDLSTHSWYDPMEQIRKLTQKDQVQLLIPLMGQIVDSKNLPNTIAWWKSSTEPIQDKELVLNSL